MWDDDDEGWQDMPIIRGDTSRSSLDEEDRKKFHYVPPQRVVDGEDVTTTPSKTRANKSKGKGDTDLDYTRIQLDEDLQNEEVYMRSDFLFDEDKDMTPISQMQATKNLLTEGQRIAYVGLCKLVSKQIVHRLEIVPFKEMKPASASARNWATKIMGRLYLHMDVNSSEQRMFDLLSEHGVTAEDLVPSLMTTHVVPNPEYDPTTPSYPTSMIGTPDMPGSETDEEADDHHDNSLPPDFATFPSDTDTEEASDAEHDTTTETITLAEKEEASTLPLEEPTEDNLIKPLPSSLPGVSTTLTSHDKTVTLDIRWTVLCDLFLALIADSVYDARSRVLLGELAEKLGLSWSDVVRFERRLTEALQLQEGIAENEHDEIMSERAKKDKKKRIMMMAAAGLGGGIVIGLSAGLLAPVIGAGIGATLGMVGISGTSTFLAGTGGAAIITTGAALSGTTIASRGMGRRTAHVKTFEFKLLHNNKRLCCYITVPGFMTGLQDDVRLPFSVLDPVLGDVYSLLWEPETILQTGSALKILTSEILTQAGQQILAMTVMTALMSAVQLPVMLTKLAYLIDNPWSNALDRARQTGAVLADVLIKRHVGVRPVSLIGYSLGARVIFYALVELAKQKQFGIVQDAFLLGATVTASKKQWREVRGVVAGRFVNGYAKNDWILGYLFRATTGGIATVAGLTPVEGVPDIENVDLTGVVSGHMSYRSRMPSILKFLGFDVTSDTFDEPPEDDELLPEREVLTPEEEERRLREREKKASKWKWGRKKTAKPPVDPNVTAAALSGPTEGTADGLQRFSSDSYHYDEDPTLFNADRIRREIEAIERENADANKLPEVAVIDQPLPVPEPVDVESESETDGTEQEPDADADADTNTGNHDADADAEPDADADANVQDTTDLEQDETIKKATVLYTDDLEEEQPEWTEPAVVEMTNSLAPPSSEDLPTWDASLPDTVDPAIALPTFASDELDPFASTNEPLGTSDTVADVMRWPTIKDETPSSSSESNPWS